MRTPRTPLRLGTGGDPDMGDRCQITAVRGRYQVTVHGDAQSEYVRVLAASGWRVTVAPAPAEPEPVDRRRVAEAADADTDGW